MVLTAVTPLLILDEQLAAIDKETESKTINRMTNIIYIFEKGI